MSFLEVLELDRLCVLLLLFHRPHLEEPTNREAYDTEYHDNKGMVISI